MGRQFLRSVTLITLGIISLTALPPRLQAATMADCTISPHTQNIDLLDTGTNVSLPLRPNIPVLFSTNLAYNERGRIDWYIDGILAASGAEGRFCSIFEQARNATFEVRFADTGNFVRFPIEIASFRHILLHEIVPNPIGTDSKSEKIVLFNDNSSRVVIKNWQLRSRTSRTVIPISGVIAPYGFLTVMASSKLVNAGGAYDLYNESNEIVDTLMYDAVTEGTILTRTDIFWGQDTSHRKSSDVMASTSTETPVIIRGKITKPSGRTIDIVSDDGQPIRIVLHSSYRLPKPKLYKGDVIEASGIWRRSRRGQYLSVRDGHTLILLYGAEKRFERKPAPSIKKAHASLPLEERAVVAATVQENTAIVSQPLNAIPLAPGVPSNPVSSLSLASITALGLLLLLPITRKKSV